MEPVFYNNRLCIIEKDGTVLPISIEGSLKNHLDAFQKAEQQVPDLLKDYQWNPSMNGGYEICSFIAANGRVVICPSNINENHFMIVAVPKELGEEQYRETQKRFEELDNSTMAVASFSYKKPNNKKSKIIMNIINQGDNKTCMEKLEEYYKKQQLEQMLKPETNSNTNKQK